MTPTSRRVWLGLLFGLELVNGLFHHGVQRATPAGSFGLVDVLATAVLLMLLVAVGAVGAWPARRLRSGASWAAGFWLYAMLTSYLIVLEIGGIGSTGQSVGNSLAAAVALAPVAALLGCAGVLFARLKA